MSPMGTQMLVSVLTHISLIIYTYYLRNSLSWKLVGYYNFTYLGVHNLFFLFVILFLQTSLIVAKFKLFEDRSIKHAKNSSPYNFYLIHHVCIRHRISLYNNYISKAELTRIKASTSSKLSL